MTKVETVGTGSNDKTYLSRLLLKPGLWPWTWALKNLNPKNSIQENMDPKKTWINMGLKAIFEFRELCSIKIMGNVKSSLF